MNFAAVHKLPVVFVIENNLIAISTRIERQTAVKDIAEKAAGYAMPGHVADGMDMLDSYGKTKLAADHARAGKGPSLVELKCYRYQPHTSDDDDSRYRTKKEVDEWRVKDPVKRAHAYLVSAGVTEQELGAIRASLADEIEKAIEQAESEPDPRPEDAATHVYAADNPLPDGTRA
jgi:2-oxoisovalerate dehydrogenase E1 component alpha subunit